MLAGRGVTELVAPKGEPPDDYVTVHQWDNERRLCRDGPHNGV